MKIFLFSLMVFFLSHSSQAQIAFEIEDSEELLAQISDRYSGSILDVTDYDMEAAFELWLSLMVEMEEYGKRIDVDLSGVKIWAHVFINPDGKIDYFGYAFRPQSVVMKKEEMRAFLKSFIAQYNFPIKPDLALNHYTSVGFPVFAQRKD